MKAIKKLAFDKDRRLVVHNPTSIRVTFYTGVVLYTLSH
jgi:hypothetical protein